MILKTPNMYYAYQNYLDSNKWYKMTEGPGFPLKAARAYGNGAHALIKKAVFSNLLIELLS